MIVFTIMILIIGIRIAYLAFPENRNHRQHKSDVVRGSIEDRRGLTLAMTEEGSTIAISPQDIVDPEFTARNLSKFLKLSTNDILQKFYYNQDRRYFLLARQVDNFTADRIMEMRLPGVHREWEYRRFYPGDSLASNLIGFVGRDQSRALEGVERVYHDILTNPEKRLLRKGPTLRLTIDSLIQYRMEQAIGPTFEESGSKRAAGLLMDIYSGEILALVNFPNYNPNQYYRSSPAQRGNWVIRMNYEPGSTVKIFMAAILLTEHAVSPYDRFTCDGEFRLGSVIIRDKHGDRLLNYGDLTLEEIIQHSSNVGIIKAMQRIRRDRLYYYMNELGFGERTNILPSGSGETSGYLPDLQNWVPSTSYYLPIGQGFSVTPIQLLRAAASIANGGKVVRPILKREIVSSEGLLLDIAQPQSRPGPFDPEINQRVLKMMRLVVEKGTGWRANIPDMPIAGKTGTAQKSSATGYSENVVSSFIGFFPADKPRYGGLIVFDEPENHESGGTIAAPTFKTFVESVLPLIQNKHGAEKVPELKPLSPIRQKVNENILYDFHGLSANEALDIIRNYYQKPVRLIGAGYVYKQWPDPDTNMKDVDKIRLYLDEME